MKRIFVIFLAFALICSLAACNNESSEPSSTPTSPEPSEQDATSTPNGSSDQAPAETDSQASSQGSDAKILIAYFTMPENADTNGVDAVAGASIVVSDGEVMGNVEYMANVIQETVGGDLFRIETVQQYPLDHDPLVDQAAEEQDADARPELATHIENPDQYDVIILGYPNWWGDMPQALYTFLEEYDFSGKTIIPFCPHGGSGFSRTEDTIAELQPNATVSENGLAISRSDVAESADEVAAWAEGLGL